MLTPRRLLRRLRALFGRSRLDRELDDELAFHLAMNTESRVRAGQPPGDVEIPGCFAMYRPKPCRTADANPMAGRQAYRGPDRPGLAAP